MKIAALTSKEVNPDTTIDDYLAFNLLREKGIQVDTLIWDDEHNWKDYDLVIVRTTWDYMGKLELFKNTLTKISEQTKLLNPVKTMLWNSNKKYLLELAEAGIPTIPSLYRESINQKEIEQLLSDPQYSHGVVIKPCVGASSLGIQFIKDISDFKEVKQGEWLIQPLQSKIQDIGEQSLFFFNGEFSHAICKKPKEGEFRCQEEYGSQITQWQAEAQAQEVAKLVFKNLDYPIHYARVDLLQNEQGEYQVIELELIEPCLYLSTAKNAPENFMKMLLTELEH